MRDTTGNMPPLPGIFPDYMAPIVRNAPDGVRELMMARWGMPGPPVFGGAPITNIRNTKSPHWRRWLKLENRCVVPFTSFCEYAQTKPKKTPTWFAFNKSLHSRYLSVSGQHGAARAGQKLNRSRVSIDYSASSPPNPTT
jgi:putative SOS response-associated peptidase YedK